MVAIARLDSLRSLAFGGISGAYAAVGSPTTVLTRIICFTNNTAGDMLFTNDNTTDQFFVAAGSFKLIDIQANMNAQFDDKYVFPVGMQWYVKQLTAPVSGSVYIEIIH
jgi:hypothetical protein